MPHRDPGSLWSRLSAAGSLGERALWGAGVRVGLGELESRTTLGDRLEELRDRSVLIATRDQLTAALALIELDGVARRLVLCPPDLLVDDVLFASATAEVDATVSDRADLVVRAPDVGLIVECSSQLVAGNARWSGHYETEWILLTSGTTGAPKLVVHTLGTLAAAIKGDSTLAAPAVWSTFYDIRRYGGLQIFLRALLGGGSLVLSSAQEAIGDFLSRAGGRGVTHISGTPSQWRRALMSRAAKQVIPHYVRLSGEIADQTILDHLRGCYPGARIAHAFASTEAGVAFAVDDGLEGFPESLLRQCGADVEMKVERGSLRIRSGRTAVRYLGSSREPLADAEGFVDTGDIVELRGNRYHFVGRRDGIINVGGLKVHPEEVEAVINGHPRVQMSLVRARKNPIMGAMVVADVVLNDGATERCPELEGEILERCRHALTRHKLPAAIRFVPTLAVAGTGKLVREHA